MGVPSVGLLARRLSAPSVKSALQIRLNRTRSNQIKVDQTCFEYFFSGIQAREGLSPGCRLRRVWFDGLTLSLVNRFGTVMFDRADGMNQLFKLLIGSALLLGSWRGQAQFSAPGGLPPGFHHALFDVLTGGPAFSGRAKIGMSNGTDQNPGTISCNIAFLSDKMRVDVDSFDPGTNVPPAEAANVKNIRSSILLRPDRNRMYLIFPQFRAYVELSYSRGAGQDPVPPAVITRNPLGKEAVGIQPCLKSQWNISEVNGDTYDLTVWNATNLDNFPIQIRLGPPTALLEFEDLHMQAPDSGLFETPSGYVRYEGVKEILSKELDKGTNTNGSQP